MKEEILKKLDREIAITQSNIEMHQRDLIEYLECSIPKKIFLLTLSRTNPQLWRERILSLNAQMGTLINIKEIIYNMDENK